MKLSIKFDMDDIVKKLQATLDRIFSRSNMKILMQETAMDIRKRTRLGYGVESDLKAKEKLKGLSPKYKERRKRDKYKELNRQYTNANKSNLTYTGQMLDALTGKSQGSYRGTIFLKDTRKPMVNQSQSFGNNQLAIWNAEKGRNFLAVSDLEYKRLTKKIEKELTATIRKAFGKK